jgi:hypothetical protein
MKLGSKPGLAAGLAVLVLAAPASAAPVTVDLRIEGPNRTVFEGPVTTDVRTFHFTGDAEHPCDNGTGAVTRGAVITAAADTAPFTTHGSWFDGLGASFSEVGGENVAYDPATDRFLVEYKNERGADVGACQDPVQNGDRVLFAFAKFDDPLLKLSGPSSAHTGDTVTLTVTDTASGQGVPGAEFEPNGPNTGPDGTVRVTLTQSGTRTFKASKTGSVRSNALPITTVAPGQPLPPPQSGGPGAAPDRLAPLAKLLGIADRQTFARGKGPRTLKASASDVSGLAAVKLRLTRRSGGRCFYFSGRRQELERTRCGRAFFFKVGESPDVSYLLPERLGPGRYVLDLAAVDRAGNRSALARGSTRVVFTVR